MALAENDEQYRFTSEIFDELTEREKSLNSEIQNLESMSNKRCNPENDVDAAIAFAENLTNLVENENGLDQARQLFELTNLRLFLKFQKVQVKKRKLNRVAGGILTIGSQPWPIEPYNGPTSRDKILKSESVYSGEEGNSLGNRNRDDRI